ncbi:MAG: tetratricopeptide repeat protein, partial [Flammeovirgaceae bacterium]
MGYSTYGQTKEIDSLQSQLASSSSTTQRITILNQLANIFQYSDDSLRLTKYLNEAITLSKREKYVNGLKYAYTTLGSIHLNKANLAEAEKNFKLSERLVTVGDEDVAIRNYNFLAELYCEQGKYVDALKLIDGALKLGKNQLSGESIVTHCIAASISQVQSNTKKAKQHLQLAKASLKPSTSKIIRLKLYKQLFKYYRISTNLDSLTLCARKINELSEELSFNFWKVGSLQAESFLNYEQGAYGNSLNLILRSLDIINPNLFKLYYTNLLYQAGSFYHELD